MSMSDQIRMLCARLNISKAKLARRIGQSPQSFSGKMKRESFTVAELKQIVDDASVSYVHKFTFKNEEEI